MTEAVALSEVLILMRSVRSAGGHGGLESWPENYSQWNLSQRIHAESLLAP